MDTTTISINALSVEKSTTIKSPCKQECKLGEDRQSCEVCHRTLKEIEEYGRNAKKATETSKRTT